MNIKDIKQVSSELTLKQISECVNETIDLKTPKLCPNVSFDDLLKAEYVRSLMERENMKQKDAIRKLASNIRALQSN
jgi:hypothetical protein